MMNLEIESVVGNGTDNEYVKLHALADCNLNEYVLFDSTFDENGCISNKHRHMCVFPKVDISEGDYVLLYTKEGEYHKFKNHAGSVTHNFYWGLKCHVWNDDGDTVHLIHYDGYTYKNVK